jgi:hypothetical protein
MSTPSPTPYYTMEPTPTEYAPTPTVHACPTCAACPGFNDQIKDIAYFREPWWRGLVFYLVALILLVMLLYTLYKLAGK